MKTKSCSNVVSHYNTEKRSQADESVLWPLTSTHALVVSQHVASGTHTLIWTEGVDTTEGTKQRILGALIDICNQEGRRKGWFLSISWYTINWRRQCWVCSPCKSLTFAGHHGSRFESLLALALKTSHYVGAGSVATWVSNGALISVWRRQRAGIDRWRRQSKAMTHLYCSTDFKSSQ